jgi:hypothetical protein
MQQPVSVGFSRSWLSWLCVAALVAGSCDIAFATGYSYARAGVAPSRVLKFVASGALGPAALQGGAGMAALGLGFHYFNAFLITAIFFAAAAWRPALVRRPLPVGLLYGVVIYLVMNFVVIPLSRIGPRSGRATLTVVSELLVHMFLIGLPMALAARRAFGDRQPG